MVPTEGLEPPHSKAHGPEPCASTNSATWALMLLFTTLYYSLLLLRTTMMNNSLLVVVPTEGLEPPHPKAHGPEPCASTNSATWALYCYILLLFYCMLLLLRTTTMNNSLLVVVPTEGLEPPHPKAHGPEPCASTNSATWALLLLTTLCCFLLYAACSAARTKS